MLYKNLWMKRVKKTSAAHYGCVMLCYCFMLKLSGWINMCKPLNLEFYALIRLSRIDLRALFSWSHTSTALNELNGANVYAGCHNEQTWELFRMKVARSQQWASPFMTLNHTNYFSEEKHHKNPVFSIFFPVLSLCARLLEFTFGNPRTKQTILLLTNFWTIWVHG